MNMKEMGLEKKSGKNMDKKGGRCKRSTSTTLDHDHSKFYDFYAINFPCLQISCLEHDSKNRAPCDRTGNYSQVSRKGMYTKKEGFLPENKHGMKTIRQACCGECHILDISKRCVHRSIQIRCVIVTE